MPVFRSGAGQVPAWCELRTFDIVTVRPGETYTYERAGAKEKLIIGRGACRVRIGSAEHEAEDGAILDLPVAEDVFVVSDVTEAATLIRMAGNWGEEVGGSGLFGVSEVADPKDGGDLIHYVKRTNFDAHFHDCDEYWIVFEGHGVAVSEGKLYEVGPGDCVATGMGHHHDFPSVTEPVRAVFFETTLEGLKRRGHLWEHTHGPAEPRADRL